MLHSTTQKAQPYASAQRWYAALFAVLICIACLTAFIAISGLPKPDPIAAPSQMRTADALVVRAAALSYLDDRIADPLVQTVHGQRHSSAVGGFALNGQVYYYFFNDAPRVDPVGAGLVASARMTTVLSEPEGDRLLTIYTIGR